MNHYHPQIHLRREAFKFSSAHMTVFPDETKESLHGHNYSVEIAIEIKEIQLSQMIPFSSFKSALKEICDLWDEKVLLASQCPYFKIHHQNPNEIEFHLCKKRYVLPNDEIVLLGIDNITAENLAQEFCRQFILKLQKLNLLNKLNSILVRIDESPGQGASVQWKNTTPTNT